MTHEELLELIQCSVNYDEDLLNNIYVLDTEAFADAAIGLSEDNRVIYDYEKMVEGLVTHDGMSPEEAMEWIDYNTIRTLPYIPIPPIILYPFVK